jgi:hypothetical protein
MAVRLLNHFVAQIAQAHVPIAQIKAFLQTLPKL